MTFSEKLKEARKNAGLTQEQLAEKLCVSRQAVTKWEADQSAPSTDNLFRLAEIFGTGVDLLLTSGEEESRQTVAEQLRDLLKAEEEKQAASRRVQRKRNWIATAVGATAYLMVYLIGRIIWCDFSSSSFVGWLFLSRPAGEHSYLYGWLLSSRLFWYAMTVSVLPALWGKYRYCLTTFAGFMLGLLLGIWFGPYPEGAATGHTHYGWAIWGVTFLISLLCGVILERVWRKRR